MGEKIAEDVTMVYTGGQGQAKPNYGFGQMIGPENGRRQVTAIALHHAFDENGKRVESYRYHLQQAGANARVNQGVWSEECVLDVLDDPANWKEEKSELISL